MGSSWTSYCNIRSGTGAGSRVCSRTATTSRTGQASTTWGRPRNRINPSTRVSWFAARAYCAARAGGCRVGSNGSWRPLRTKARPDARRRSAVAGEDSRLVRAARDPSIGEPWESGPANFYGIQDLHGLVWEWVEDFNALIVSGDSRDQGDPDKLKFCGAGALSLKDRENYAVLMRIAFLSSLEARSTARTWVFAVGGRTAMRLWTNSSDRSDRHAGRSPVSRQLLPAGCRTSRSDMPANGTYPATRFISCP